MIRKSHIAELESRVQRMDDDRKGKEKMWRNISGNLKILDDQISNY